MISPIICQEGNVAVGEDNLTLENIITQKYIAFWLFQPIEAYNDYRRTLIPDLNNPVSPPPNRFPYPQDRLRPIPMFRKEQFRTKYGGQISFNHLNKKL
jgi:hypothetical protein